MSFKLEAADVSWQNNEPRSLQFDDVYYSHEGGLEESRYVFLSPNRIEQRLSSSTGHGPITVAETGFGTGLNFLATLQAWEKLPEPKHNLCFVSVEKFPLDKVSIQKAHAAFPELKQLSSALLAQYPLSIKGSHSLKFHGGKVSLLLILGDALEALTKSHFLADAWYLDGFNPADNASMWSERLFSTISAHSKTGTTVSTFTAAGFVRRGLSEQGFAMHKQKGFGSKREMLTGIKTGSSSSSEGYFAENCARWSIPSMHPPKAMTTLTATATPAVKHLRATMKSYDAAVIGAGISGLCSAKSLADQGLETLLLDRKSAPVQGASGQSSLMMYAKLPAIFNQEAELILVSMGFAQNFYTQLQVMNPEFRFWDNLGVLQLDWSDKEAEQNRKRHLNLELPPQFMARLSSQEASEKAGIPLKTGGLWFPRNGRLFPDMFARACLKAANIDALFNETASQLAYCEKQNLWQINTLSGKYHARNVIVANAYEAGIFDQTKGFPINTIRGQVSSVFDHGHLSPACILCGEGYVSPNADGSLHIGATYDLQGKSDHATPQDHLENLAKCQRWMPGDWIKPELLKRAPYRSSAGIRCTSRDYQPIAGPVPNRQIMRERFSKLSADRRACEACYGEFYPNLYINIGHGSKGMVTAPVTGALITSLITGAPSPLQARQYEMLSPARFIIRDLIRGELKHSGD